MPNRSLGPVQDWDISGFTGDQTAWVIDGNNRVLATQDAGENWFVWGEVPSLLQNSPITGFFLSADTREAIIVGNIRRHINGDLGDTFPVIFVRHRGEDWRLTFRDLKKRGVYRLEVTPRLAFGFLDNELIVSTNLGATWRPIHLDPACTRSREFDAGLAAPLVRNFLDGGPLHLDATTAGLLWLTDNNGFLLHSKGDGQTWCDAYPDPRSAEPERFLIFFTHFSNAVDGLAVISVPSRFIETHDGGRSWTELDAPTPDQFVRNSAKHLYVEGRALYLLE